MSCNCRSNLIKGKDGEYLRIQKNAFGTEWMMFIVSNCFLLGVTISFLRAELLLGSTHGSHLREPQVIVCGHNYK